MKVKEPSKIEEKYGTISPLNNTRYRFYCPECPEYFITAGSFMSHLSWIHQEKYIEICRDLDNNAKVLRFIDGVR